MVQITRYKQQCGEGIFFKDYLHYALINDKLYSVDMMLIYVNNHDIPIKKVNVLKLLKKHLTAEYHGWWCNEDDCYTMCEVLENPDKYKTDFEQIMKADLSKPIILTTNDDIIDGRHRLVKSALMNMKKIPAYYFNDRKLKMFEVDEPFDNVNQLLELYLEKVPS